MITSCVADDVTLNWLEVTCVSPVAVKVSVKVPVPVILRSVKVATPLTAETVVVPESAPLPETVFSVAVTAFEELVARSPPAVRALTIG